MAIGLSHVTSARHVGRNRGRAYFRPLPTHQHNTNESTESTGFDVGRHRTVKDLAVLRPAALGWCGRNQGWWITPGDDRQALRGALCANKKEVSF